MPNILSDAKLRAYIKTEIPSAQPYQVSMAPKIENIQNFNALPRKGLVYGEQECRVLLYTTQAQEKIYIQYPGAESVRTGNRQYVNDFRPILVKKNGTRLPDLDFKKIWDIIDRIGIEYRAHLDILGTVFLRIAYMVDYHHNEDISYPYEIISVPDGAVISASHYSLTWNSFALPEEVIATLQDHFSAFEAICGISLEGFLCYNDLLAQNEDCKYYYRQGSNWNMTAGRINNCLSHLTVISHLRGKIGISKLIDSFSRTGVAPLPQTRLDEACGDLVVRV